MSITDKQYNQITFRGAKWLLLFVFYLQFLIPVLFEAKWSKYISTPIPDNFVMVSIQLFAVLVPCIVFLYLNSADFEKSLNLSHITLPQGIMCALIGITAQSVASVLNIPMLLYIKSKTGELPGMAVSTPANISQLLTGLLVVALLPAFFEEILMRGIVLITTREKGYRASLVISGLYFALIHNQVENILGHFFLGLVMCYIVWMTESVWGGIIAHFFFNAFGMTFDYLTAVGSATAPWLASGAFYWIVTIICVLLFFLFIGTINRKRIRRNKSHHLIRQLIFSVINFPVILIVLGYIMFQIVRY